MAAEAAAMPINGAFAPQQPPSYAATEQNLATHNAHSANAPPPSVAAAPNVASGNAEISKEEVGWYFVERYYTTLSKNPDKLFLFYNKRSQSVFGVEEEKAPVCVGQRAINDRMKELDFQDCKVRVTNVDSQAAGSDIVIQVIGEVSNKSAPHRKFVQTFVLATQTNGYFVLNDIFRYIAEEEEPVEQEETRASPNAEGAVAGYQEPVPTVQETEPKTLTNSSEAVEQEQDAHFVDEELEKVIKQEEKEAKPPTQVNGTPVPESADAAQPEEPPAAPVAAPGTNVAEDTVSTVTEADLQPEKPKDPTPSPAPPPAAQPPSTTPKAPAAAPPKPAAPKTWASLAASANRTAPSAAPAVSAPTPAQQKTAQQPATQTTAPQAAPAAAAAPARAASPAEGQQGDGWQAVGGDHNRKQSRAQGQAGNETPRFRAYIKNVYPSVDGSALRTQLSKYGELAYFDISRQKNCAFVDFVTLEGFQAAVNANPHQVGSDQIYVEERRERPYPYAPRGGMRGGRGGTDTRASPGRGGFAGKENARPGSFQSRGGRGGSGTATPRGRGGAQVV